MKNNIGTVDKVIRILIALVVAVLYFAHIVSGVLAIVLLAVAAVLFLTAILNFCPIWYALGISTRKIQK
jgi:hypothetical protein